MKRIAGPSIKSIAYRILAALEGEPHGILTNAQLLPVLTSISRSNSKLLKYYPALAALDLVLQLPDGLQLLPDGRAYLRQNHCALVFEALPEIKPLETGSMALPRTVKPFKPLSMVRMMRGKPMRDGMDDHRSVPSLIGNTRVVSGE